MSAPHSQFSALLRLHCVLFSARTTYCSLLAPSCVPGLYCASLATCLLCFLVVSLRHKEYSRNSTHSSPQPPTVMLCQPVLGSFQPVTPGLVTPQAGTPLAMLLSLNLHDFSKPVLHKFAHTDANWLPAGSQYFRTKCFPFAQHRVLPSTFMIYT